jgi:hypothetical protein
MNIPTAKEFIISTKLVVKFDNTQGCILEEELPSLFIEFAKLHVQAALKAADDNSIMYKDLGEGEDGELCCVLEKTFYDNYDNPILISADSILNAYPLENIK